MAPECRFTADGECLALTEGFAPCDGSEDCDYEGFREEHSDRAER